MHQLFFSGRPGGYRHWQRCGFFKLQVESILRVGNLTGRLGCIGPCTTPRAANLKRVGGDSESLDKS